jgi:hypothetical protein
MRLFVRFPRLVIAVGTAISGRPYRDTVLPNHLFPTNRMEAGRSGAFLIQAVGDLANGLTQPIFVFD